MYVYTCEVSSRKTLSVSASVRACRMCAGAGGAGGAGSGAGALSTRTCRTRTAGSGPRSSQRTRTGPHDTPAVADNTQSWRILSFQIRG